MRFVSPMLKRIVYPSLAGLGYFRKAAPRGLAVVTYHGVLPQGQQAIDVGFDGSQITCDAFRQQLRLLRMRYTVVTPDDVRAWARHERQLPPRAVLLTCDDGLLNNLTEMLPILQEEGLRCLFFVTGASAGDRRATLWYQKLLLLFLRAPAGTFTISSDGVEIRGSLGEAEQRRALWWSVVNRLSQADAERRERFLQAAHAHFALPDSLEFYMASYPQAEHHFCLLTRSELRRLADAGMTIGAHTLTHPVLSQLLPEHAWNEIADCRTRLESVLGTQVWAFAYPFGNANSVTPRVLEIGKEAGFEAAFLNFGGGLGVSLPLHAIPRIHVSAEMSLAEFEACVSGFYESLRHRLRRTPQAHTPVIEAADV